MEDDFKIIAYTPERPIPGEAEMISMLLGSGAVDIVHLRHKLSAIDELRAILDAISPALHSRIMLHSHADLLHEYALMGMHRKSCHSVAELDFHPQYCTLSPIFPSISKPGYKGDFDLSQLPDALRGKNVVALGGVMPEKFAMLADLGFCGAAMLGYCWDKRDFYKRLRRTKIMRPGRFSLQYITNGATPAEVAAETTHVLDGGCRWIQVRMKDAPDAVVAEAVEAVKPLCAARKAMLLIDDRVELAGRLGVDGVHLGKNDMAPAQARKILGETAIIGSTANSIEDIRLLSSLPIDYIGLGPFRFTTTKKNLAPTLGIEGYRQIFSAMRCQDIDIPVVAIGGITSADAPAILASGASGIAASGAIETFLSSSSLSSSSSTGWQKLDKLDKPST